MFRAIKVITAVFVSLGQISAAFADTRQYGMSLHSELITTANGAITSVPQANVDNTWDVAEKQVTEVVEGVYRIAGWGIGNVIAIEGPKGWLIIDTGDDVAQATEQRAALEKKLGKQIQVTGVAYTHSHYAMGTTVWMDEGTEVYAHEDLLPNLMADSGVSVLSGNFNSRLVMQFGILHPTEGPDAFPSKLGFSAEKLTGEKGFVPPTVTFKDGEIETHRIAGLTVEVLPSKTEQAARVVEAKGGVEAVTAKAQAAADKGDTASSQWALFLTSQLQDMGALEGESRQARANATRTLGQHTTSANARGFYISEALLHEGKVAFGDQVITDYRQLNEVFGAVTADKLAASPLQANVHYLRFMVDSRLAEGKRAEFNVNFSDEGVSYAIALRNGVIAITDEPSAGNTFELSKADWDALILGSETFASLDSSLRVIDLAIGR